MSKIDDLKKKLRVMNIRGSKSLTLDKDYIAELLEEIQALEEDIDAKTTQSEENINKMSSGIIHGGNF